MTPQERCDAIAKELYCGSIPDIWCVLAERLIKHHIMEAEREAAERMRDQCLEAYRHSGTSEEVENRIRALPVTGMDAIKREK